MKVAAALPALPETRLSSPGCQYYNYDIYHAWTQVIASISLPLAISADTEELLLALYCQEARVIITRYICIRPLNNNRAGFSRIPPRPGLVRMHSDIAMEENETHGTTTFHPNQLTGQGAGADQGACCCAHRAASHICVAPRARAAL